MKPTPPGWPRLSQCIYYQDPKAAIAWLGRAFGFEVRLLVEDDTGGVAHSELTFGDGLIMVGGTGRTDPGKGAWQSIQKSPKDLGGGNTQSVCVMVDSADAHCERARAAGATILREPHTEDYGDDYWSDRSYGAVDPEGHLWWFIERVRTGPKK